MAIRVSDRVQKSDERRLVLEEYKKGKMRWKELRRTVWHGTTI